MQGNMCRITALGGKSPPGKNGESSYKRYIKWLCVARNETISGYKGVLETKASQNIKRNMRLLRKDMAMLYKGLPHPRGKNVSMGTKCKKGDN